MDYIDISGAFQMFHIVRSGGLNESQCNDPTNNTLLPRLRALQFGVATYFIKVKK